MVCVVLRRGVADSGLSGGGWVKVKAGDLWQLGVGGGGCWGVGMGCGFG